MTVDNTVSYDDMMDNMQNYSPKKSQPLSVEELLQPRYEVIADYPGSRYKIGDIIEYPETEVLTHDGWCKLMYEPYPAIFKKLSWWEKRSESDMPKYLKIVSGHFAEDYGKIGEAEYLKHGVTIWLRKEGNASHRPIKDTLPASESEYITYINQHQ